MASALTYPLHFALVFLLLSIIFVVAQSQNNIALGSSLNADNRNNSSWESSSREFAFGFQRTGTGGYYLLGIWFNKIPERTMVWSANRDNPVPEGSKVRLTAEGFMLIDPKGQPIKQIAHVPRISYASMLDSGNFLLVGQDSNTLWQSFDEPTDTLLPTQNFSKGSNLVASFSEANYSIGRFQFALESDGNLVLYTRNFPLQNLDDVVFAYWSTNTVGSGFQLKFNQSGYVYLIAQNATTIFPVFSSESSPNNAYQRVVLDSDGVLRQYVYPKSANATAGRPLAWSVVSFMPSNICTRIRQSTGGGACGFNSYCNLGNERRPKCECPSGYSYINPNDELGGCKPNFLPQNCDEETQETDLFSFVDMPDVNWPDGDYNNFRPVSEDWCRQECLSDCFCAAVVFNNGNCWKKRSPLSNGRIEAGSGGKSLIKVRKDNTTCKYGETEAKKKDRSTLIITGSILLGTSTFLNWVLFLSILLSCLHSKNRKTKIVQDCAAVAGINLWVFSCKELEKVTNVFEEEIGKGACSTVYKGVLKHENGDLVAVKKLDKKVGEIEQEFVAEMTSIGRANHKNLVRLLGFCNEGENRLLVYEFMSNGSLASLLFENSRPQWYKRKQIASGIARGLHYLHDECSTQIIHCDIKPQNILLDGSFTARISDFGLAKILRMDQTQTTTALRGTRGYVAPEWFKNMPITVKVDVYSFGIMLLELICCRRSFERDEENEDEMVLADWAFDCYKEGRTKFLVADDEEAMDDIKQLEKFVMIAIWCIQEEPSLRPTMKKVTLMLEGAVQVSVPPDPSSFISSV